MSSSSRIARAHPGRALVRASAGAVVTAPALFMHPPCAIRDLPGINTRVCSGNSPIGGKASDPAQHRGYFTENRGVGAVDGIVGGVVRQQPHISVLALERLDRRLAVDHRGDDLAVLGGGLLA